MAFVKARSIGACSFAFSAMVKIWFYKKHLESIQMKMAIINSFRMLLNKKLLEDEEMDESIILLEVYSGELFDIFKDKERRESDYIFIYLEMCCESANECIEKLENRDVGECK